MTMVLIIVEAEVLNKPVYFGKSGDAAIIDYFLRNNWQVCLLDVENMQGIISSATEIFEVQSGDYSTYFYQSMALECTNILQGKTPATNGDKLKFHMKCN